MQSTPQSNRIWLTQEDLCVYEELLVIIARTNQEAGADRYSNAKIRDIYSLDVGARAAQASRGKGRIVMVAPVGGVGDPSGMDRGMGMMGRGMEGGEMGGYGEMMGGGRGAGMDFGEQSYGGGMGGGMYGRGGEMGGGLTGDAALFASRYLDNDGKPIQPTGDGGLDEFGNKEFKRLPIRMQLEMDQRWLPHLIAECANAPLQVEVTEVRISPAGGIASSGSGRGRGGGSRSNRVAGGRSGEPMIPEHEPNIKPVIIQGTIFIFNPPSEDPRGQQVAVTQ